MVAQINGNILCRRICTQIVISAQIHILQQLDGPAALNGVDGSLQRSIASLADLSNSRSQRTVIPHIASRCCHIHSVALGHGGSVAALDAAVDLQLAIDGAALQRQRHCILVFGAAGNLDVTVDGARALHRHGNAGVVAVAAGVQSKGCTVRTAAARVDGGILDHHVAAVVGHGVHGVGTAGDLHPGERQVAVVLDQDGGCARPTRRVIARHRSIAVDRAVLEGDLVILVELEAVAHGAAGANQLTAHGVGVTGEVDRQALAGKRAGLDPDTVAGAIPQQGDGVAVLGSCESLGQRLIGRLTDLRSSSGRLDYAIGGAVSIGLDLEAVSAIVVGHLARKRTGGDVELVLGGGSALFGGNVKLAADLLAVGRDGSRLAGFLDVLLEQAHAAIVGADIGQRHSCRLGHHDSRLLGQTIERGILDGDRGNRLRRTLGVHLCAASTAKFAAVQFNIAAVNPQVVQAFGGVDELAVIKHRLAVLVVAHAVGERAVGVRHGVLRRAGVAQPRGEVVGAMTIVIRPLRIQFSQLQFLEADVNVIRLISQNGHTIGDADLGIICRAHERHLGESGQAGLRHLHPAGIGHFHLAVDGIGDDAVDRLSRLNGSIQRFVHGGVSIDGHEVDKLIDVRAGYFVSAALRIRDSVNALRVNGRDRLLNDRVIGCGAVLAFGDVGAAVLALTGGFGLAGTLRVVAGRGRLSDDLVSGVAGIRPFGVHRRRQQRKHHHQRKQQ